MKRWRVRGTIDRGMVERFGRVKHETWSRVEYVDAEMRDEAQHVGRERMVQYHEDYRGAVIEVEPVDEGRGWS